MKVECISNSLSYELIMGREYEVLLVDKNSVGEEMYHIKNHLGQIHIYAAKRFKTKEL